MSTGAPPPLPSQDLLHFILPQPLQSPAGQLLHQAEPLNQRLTEMQAAREGQLLPSSWCRLGKWVRPRRAARLQLSIRACSLIPPLNSLLSSDSLQSPAKAIKEQGQDRVGLRVSASKMPTASSAQRKCGLCGEVTQPQDGGDGVCACVCVFVCVCREKLSVLSNTTWASLRAVGEAREQVKHRGKAWRCDWA